MIRVDRHGAVEVWTIDRPDAKNALSRATLEALHAALVRVEASDCRAVVLTGQGEMFAAGGDLRELRSAVTAADAEQVLEFGSRVCRGIMASRVPFIAALAGPAIGGGAELALACDLRVVGPHASICFKHARMGLTTAWGVLPKLVATIGASSASRLLFTAEVCRAKECVRLGLADFEAEEGEHLRVALEYADSIAGAAPLAVAALKQLVARSMEGESAALEEERTRFVSTWTSADHGEAVEAFFEKRGPVFRGQ